MTAPKIHNRQQRWRSAPRTALLSLGLAALAAAQTPAPQSTPPANDEKPQADMLVYQGEPLSVPLRCRASDFLRAGITCGETSPCDLYLQITSVSGFEQKVLAVGNLHTDVATISSILLWSADGGAQWREGYERIGAAGLESAQVLDRQHAWAAGQQGEQDSSSAAFVLVTADGGESWRRSDVWEQDQDRSGAVLEMRFEDARHGYLILDRLTRFGDPFELYESMNGGRSWGLRQVSAERPQIPPRARSATAPGWRIAEDPEAGAYAIETLAGGQWTRRASFSVDVGQCRGMEAETPFEAEKGP